MVNKAGWTRIIEATIGVLLVLGVLITLNARTAKTGEPDLSDRLPPLLDEITRSGVIRTAILTQPESVAVAQITPLLAAGIPDDNLNYSVRICAPLDPCAAAALESYPGAIYSSEQIILSTSKTFNPKKVKLYLWRNRRAS